MRIVAGNWKMNLNAAQTRALVAEIQSSPLLGTSTCQVWIAPPFTSLWAARESLQADSKLVLGAQDAHWETSGAFTGEVSVGMLAEIGCSFVLVGHSERRTLFGERGEILTKKIKALLKSGITPLFCIGESLEERQQGKTLEVLRQQLHSELFPAELFPTELAQPGESLPSAAKRPSQASLPRLVIAYEPVWAIGTGLVASPNDIAEAHAFIHSELSGAGLLDIPILYGGSVSPDNSSDVLGTPHVSGALVGGASLTAAKFIPIIDSASK